MHDGAVNPLIEMYNLRQDQYQYLMSVSEIFVKDQKIKNADRYFNRKINLVKKMISAGYGMGFSKFNKTKNDFTSLTFYFESKPVANFKTYEQREKMFNHNNLFLARQFVIRSVVMLMIDQVVESERLFKESRGYV